MYMNKLIKKQLILILFTVVLVGTLVVTTSFAVFEDTKSNAQDQKMAVGDLDITFTGGSAINITNLSPMTDTAAKSQTNNLYTFSIANTGTVPYKFTVKLENNPSYTSNLLSHKYIRYSLNNAAVKFVSDDSGLLVEGMIEAGVTNNYSLRLWVADAETYKLPDSTLGQEIHLQINVDGKAGVMPPAPDGWYDASSGTLLAALRDNTEISEPITIPGKEVSAHTLDDVQVQTVGLSSKYQAYYITYGTGWEANGTKFNLTGTSVTSNTYANSYSSLVGKYITSTSFDKAGSNTAGTMKTTTDLDSVYYVVSATQNSFTYKQITSNKNTTEALLASTEDDYGTSYYFRGAVTNNYVQFANKCWRIVRVGGDGSVKLILHNDNTAGAANPCNSANNSGDAAFARYSGTTYTSRFNDNHDDNTYVGFKYGTTGASDYATTHANTNKSTILTNLETWYNNNLKTYESVIDNSVWCNDKTNVTDTSYDPINITPTGSGYAKNVTYYGATQRLVSTSGSAGGTGPSLKCNGELSKITSKVGLITADELAFAGYAYNIGNTTTYLQENATYNYWWSLSPRVFNGSNATVWLVVSDKGYFGGDIVNFARGVRPSISLKPFTNVTGNGTSENPYKIVS